MNTYSVFAETFRDLINANGRAGIITPTGIATDATTAPFIADTIRARRLATFFDFDNEAKIFMGVHHAFRFSLSTFTGRTGLRGDVQFAFLLRHVEDVPSRLIAMTSEEVLALNPNTGTLPIFRTRKDADITLGIYRRHPVLIRDDDPAGNPWGLKFQRMFDMANDSALFRTAEELQEGGATFDGWAWAKPKSNGDTERWLPLYEAKMLSHWNHRFSTYEGATQAQLNVGTLPRLTPKQLDDPDQESLPRYWVAESDIEAALGDRYSTGWLFGWRNITNAGNERTMVPSALPVAAVGHAFPLADCGLPAYRLALQVLFSSLVLDFVVRQKFSGSNLTFGIVRQIAVPTPTVLSGVIASAGIGDMATWLSARSLELTYTSHRVAPYARENGDLGPPYRWDPDRRRQIQTELDAAMMHVFGLERSEVEHVLDSFTGLRDNYDLPAHGEFRTKRLVLEFYDLMAKAAESGVPYETPIDPPPGQGPRHAAKPGHNYGSPT